ncbi:Stk1 family PASTA domain-containing Ser/Thr kinase [Peptacetobacter sp.]|uniref:Stk1 family PASTA domain-containing Ser/Thr kinase n=1 Tax=Peptacetobacter sp. TaxID=2991975 RepID=UPI002602A2E3|nr:Stk1 family PASTA domain-containing Ser/Thr kinase [Peptacetobacter sp.]
MGDTILGNRYKIEKKIGEGGMAYVYEAKDKLLNRVVAVKVLRPEFVDDQEFLKKFKREAEAVASLSHPNIVNVYDVGEDGKVHYIVMEYVNGKNLKEIIQEEGTLDEYTALDISKQIAMALSCAHKRGIIHRDIKPHNILISNEGRNIAKVADFGIAKAVSNSTMTNIGGVIGSVHYFSPEQAKGKFVTNNADLYSLGIVLYEMLTGKVPFRGDTPVSIALQHINDDIEFTEEEKIRIPQSVRTIIKKLTEKNTADRYQTAEEVIEDIEYIEKNIDLDFIKEYDDFATRHIDERNLNSVAKPKIVPAAIADIDGDDAGYYDDEEYDDDDYYDEEDEEDYIPKKRRKKKKKKVIQEETPKTRKKLKIAAVILSLILLAQVGVFFKLFGSSIFGSKDAIIAPNVEGMQVTQAETTVEDMGLNLKIVSYEYSYSAAENEIISQDPDAGTELKEGDTITVVVSKGNNNKEEPNVVGMTLSQAQGMIQAKGFAVGKITYEYSSAYKEGTVLAQSNSGGKISLVVSKGEDKENKPTLPNEDNNNTNNNNNNGNTGNDNTGGGSSGGGSNNSGGGSSGGGSDNSGGESSGGGSDNSGGGSSGGGESSGGATE